MGKRAVKARKRLERDRCKRLVAEQLAEMDRIFARMATRDLETARVKGECRLIGARIDSKLAVLKELVQRLETVA